MRVSLPHERSWLRVARDEGARIVGHVVDANLEMHVRSGRVAGRAFGADYLTLPHNLADMHIDRRLVSVAGGDRPTVADARVVAVPPLPTRIDNRAAPGSVYRRPPRPGTVYARRA